MSLSKKLQLFSLFIFTFIFAVNFVISVNDSKTYLQTESYNKAHVTATALALSLSPLLIDPEDSKIASKITAVADKGFFNEIRLERIHLTLTTKELLSQAQDIKFKQGAWQLTELVLDEKYGQLFTNLDQSQLASELKALNNEQNTEAVSSEILWATFTAGEDFKDGQPVTIKFKAKNTELSTSEETGTIKLAANLLMFNVIRDNKFEQTPEWFVNLFPIKLEAATSTIMHGWEKVALLSVKANTAEAYNRLYQYASRAALYSLAALIIAMIALTLYLRKILKPLTEIQHLTEDIAKGSFNTITAIPKTYELRKLTIAINNMSNKLGGFVGKLRDDINLANQQINLDPVTQLPLKLGFEHAFRNIQDSPSYGYIFIIKIDNLAIINQQKTPVYVDQLLYEFSQLLTTSCNEEIKINTSQSYRLLGGEFAILAEKITYEQAKLLATTLKEKLIQFTRQRELTNFCHIGAAAYKDDSQLIKVLNSANEALEFAKQIGPYEAVIYQEVKKSRNQQQWYTLVKTCIESNDFSINYINPSSPIKLATSENSGAITEAFTHISAQQENDVAIATFISIAEKLNLNVDFDKLVIKRVIYDIYQKEFSHNILINLSAASINNSLFINWLEIVLKSNKIIAPKIFFSISAYAAANQLTVLKQFIKKVHALRSKIIIKRYDPALLPLTDLEKLQVDAIRFTKEHINGIATEHPKQQLIKNMLEFAELMHISIYTEEITKAEDIDMLKKLSVSL